MIITDKVQLAQEGFTLIRNLLEGRVEGGVELAKDVAEALHNLSGSENSFTEKMTCEKITALQKRHPDCTSIASMTSLISNDQGAISMKKSCYRDILNEYYDADIASVVGCGLDRAGGFYTVGIQNEAIAFYQRNLAGINKLCIGDRRQVIADFVSGKKHTDFA